MTATRYDDIGVLYSRHRRADPRIADLVTLAIGHAQSIVDVGAGTGSYEPKNRKVVAVEPSEVMIRQRSRESAPILRAVAEALPFSDKSFDAAMTILSVHHWSDPRRGLAELCRVAHRRVVLTFEPAIHNRFWLFAEYLPKLQMLLDGQSTPSVEEVAELIDASVVEVVPIPHDCTDGFGWAYWRRPHAYLDPEIRACISALAMLEPADLQAGLLSLQEDLRTGAWKERHGDLLSREAIDGGFRIVIGGPDPAIR
jgi:ubiquinone/menaquinone biosynthesis C-methylase UbiE